MRAAGLSGIGYRRHERNIGKDVKFTSSRSEGIRYASYGGGTNIFIRGDDLALDPQSNTIHLYSPVLKTHFPSPPLTSDDSFSSNTPQGLLAYRLPALTDLLGVSQDIINNYQYMVFHLSVKAEGRLLKCKRPSNCKIYYRLASTPVLYEIRPPIVYLGSEAEFWFNPRGVAAYSDDDGEGVLPFANFKVDGSLVDFEVEANTTFQINHHRRNRIKGTIGDQPISNNSLPSMEWLTGYHQDSPEAMLHCSYDNETCYKARTIPVITNVSASEGYTTGG